MEAQGLEAGQTLRPFPKPCSSQAELAATGCTTRLVSVA